MADFKVTELDPQTDFENLDWWDVVIIGAGPAGLAASLTTAHRGLTTLVIEAKDEPGGQPQFLYADKKIVDIPASRTGSPGTNCPNARFARRSTRSFSFDFKRNLSASKTPISQRTTNRSEKWSRPTETTCAAR